MFKFKYFNLVNNNKIFNKDILFKVIKSLKKQI